MTGARPSVAEVVGSIVLAALAGFLFAQVVLLAVDGWNARRERAAVDRAKRYADAKHALAGPRVVPQTGDA